MRGYNQRRWEWAVKRSLERLKWDSTEGIAVSLAIIIVPAALSLVGTGSLDLLQKAVWAVLATLLVLLTLLAINWARAPAALDAEREGEIAALRAKLPNEADQFPLPPPYGLTKTQAGRMLNDLRNQKRNVVVTMDMGAFEAENMYQQTVAVFREAGWNVEDGEIFGLKAPPECGVALLRSPGIADDHIEAVRHAMWLAGIDFEERMAEGDRDAPQINFSKRDPYWVPPARWA
jgi:hypothetical protein